MDTSDFQHLKVSTEAAGRVVVLELDHGKANEMGVAVLAELDRLRERLVRDDRVVAMITFSKRRSSKGTPIFVAGANVTERRGWSEDKVMQHVRWQRKVLANLRAAPIFHIGVVSGVALGWGTEFLLVCDFRIGCDGAVFGLPETGLGIVPGAGGTSDMRAHIGIANTLRLGMTGERIDAAEAARIGLIQEVLGSLDEGLDRARALAALVAKRSPTAIAAFKDGVLRSVGTSAELRTEIEAVRYEHCVLTGEAAVGREHFSDLVKGGSAPWGPRRLMER
jgi:enoyl-CoA hydratase/carnithine racemase